MIKELKDNFKEKQVIIFGLGNYRYGSGISAAKFFIKRGAKVLITDKKNAKDLPRAVREVKNFGKKHKNSPIFVLGQHREADFRKANIVVRNPGVPADHPLLQLAREHGAQIHTDVSLFMKILGYPHPSTISAELYRTSLNPPPRGGGGGEGVKVIGITGTRGKSTTSALVAEILKKAGKKILLGGNLGYSPLNFIDEILYPPPVSSPFLRGRSGGGTIYIVLELSSWLVESLDEWKISPDYAVITNIYPDHLNTYKTMKDYIKAKAVIFKYQNPSNTLVLNKDNKITRALAKKAKARVYLFSKTFRVIPREILRNSALLGEHNLENIAAALEMAKVLGISEKQAWPAIRKFKGLWGRLQFVRNLHGVKFYNDTTATTPEATLQALRTLFTKQFSIFNSQFSIKEKNIILIAGGMDKNLDYQELAREIPKYVKALILFRGSASDKILKELRIKKQEASALSQTLNSKFLILDSVFKMQKAVRLATKIAEKGDIILLSPAAASFNIFKNEVDRGEQFIKCIRG